MGRTTWVLAALLLLLAGCGSDSKNEQPPFSDSSPPSGIQIVDCKPILDHPSAYGSIDSPTDAERWYVVTVSYGGNETEERTGVLKPGERNHPWIVDDRNRTATDEHPECYIVSVVARG